MKLNDLLKLMILIFVFILTSLHTILSEEKSFNSEYHVVVDNKI